MAFLQHPLKDRAREVARVAARVARGEEDEDDLVDVLGEMTDDLSPAFFDQFVEIAATFAELARRGDDAASEIYDAAMRTAQEVTDTDDGGRGYLFALPLAMRGPLEPKHLKNSLTMPQRRAIAGFLGASDMIDGEAGVVILPRLLPVQQAAFMTGGQVNELKKLMSFRKFSGVYETAAAVSATWSEEEAEHVKATEALEVANELRSFVLVGMVFCDDPYDPPFPLARAFTLAHEDLPHPSDPDFDSEHDDMHEEHEARKRELAEMLAPIFQADTAVLMEADSWFENMKAICSVQRGALFARIVEAIAEEWGLEGSSDLETSMPEPAEGGFSFVLKSTRGDERKLLWRQLPDEPMDRALFRFVHFMAGMEITLPNPDLLEMLAGHCDVEDGDDDADDDGGAGQSGGRGGRGTLH